MVYGQYIGILGMVLMGVSWIPQTIEIIKTGKSNLNLFFATTFTLALATLIVYSVIIESVIFIILNSFSCLMSGIGLTFTIKTRYFDKKKKKR